MKYILVGLIVLCVGWVLWNRFGVNDVVDVPNLHEWERGISMQEDGVVAQLGIAENGIIKIGRGDFDNNGQQDYVVLKWTGGSGGTLDYFWVKNGVVQKQGCVRWGKDEHYSVKLKEDLVVEGTGC